MTCITVAIGGFFAGNELAAKRPPVTTDADDPGADWVPVVDQDGALLGPDRHSVYFFQEDALDEALTEYQRVAIGEPQRVVTDDENGEPVELVQVTPVPYSAVVDYVEPAGVLERPVEAAVERCGGACTAKTVTVDVAPRDRDGRVHGAGRPSATEAEWLRTMNERCRGAAFAAFVGNISNGGPGAGGSSRAVRAALERNAPPADARPATHDAWAALTDTLLDTPGRGHDLADIPPMFNSIGLVVCAEQAVMTR